jgi:tRNA-splicing ligase RtcB
MPTRINDKLLSWASIVEPKTLGQAVMTSRMPFIQPHLALMPDAHLGKGSTVGSVIPTVGAIMPAAVGVDIGCGMIAVRTQYRVEDLAGKDLTYLRHEIERRIPLSAGRQNQSQTRSAGYRIEELEDRLATHPSDHKRRIESHTTNWRLQLGTLGSGNHFIEVVADEDDKIWLFLHSGSRGIGNRIAQSHIKVAQAYCKANFIKLEDPDLAYLTEGTEEFDQYIRDLQWAQHYALLNREEMMDRVIAAFSMFITHTVHEIERINCHHNFTQQEEHMGQLRWITRKGAISAREGELGLIPGSMGTSSYVVKGRGNVAAYSSSPHGAGRVYSRSAAKKTFSMDQLVDSMKGIEWHESEAFLDEHPEAYKDIHTVMEDAADLVEVVHEFRQLVNVKGD